MIATAYAGFVILVMAQSHERQTQGGDPAVSGPSDACASASVAPGDEAESRALYTCRCSTVVGYLAVRFMYARVECTFSQLVSCASRSLRLVPHYSTILP